MRGLKHYRWNSPYINDILFRKAFDPNKRSLRPLAAIDLVTVFWEVFPRFNYRDFDGIFDVANELNDVWTVEDFEAKLRLNFYFGAPVAKWFEQGLIRGVPETPRYEMISEFRGLLRDVNEL